MEASGGNCNIHLTEEECVAVVEDLAEHNQPSSGNSSVLVDINDKERVLKGGPRAFEKSLLVLKEPGMEQPSKMKFESAEFWVHFYDLPVVMQNVQMARKLGSSLGRVSEVDETDFLMCGRFLRVRVAIDLKKPLRRGVMISNGNRKFWVEVKYKRLPNFCYSCGKLGHVDLDCEDDAARNYQNEYGEWLRASPIKMSERSSQEKIREKELLLAAKETENSASTPLSSNTVVRSL